MVLLVPMIRWGHHIVVIFMIFVRSFTVFPVKLPLLDPYGGQRQGSERELMRSGFIPVLPPPMTNTTTNRPISICYYINNVSFVQSITDGLLPSGPSIHPIYQFLDRNSKEIVDKI